MRLYHATTAANGLAVLLRDRFADCAGQFGAPSFMPGVWLSDRPLSMPGMVDHALLAVDFDHGDSVLWQYESPDDGKGYREWRVPADVIQQKGHIRLLAVEAGRQVAETDSATTA